MVERSRRRRSVRAQATGVAVSVLAAVLCIGAGIAIEYARQVFPTEDVAMAADRRAADLMTSLASGATPDDLVHDGHDPVQIIGADGRILAAADDLEDEPPVVSETWPVELVLGDDADETYLAMSRTVPADAPSHAGVRVVVGRSPADAELSVHVVTVMFGVAIPAVLVVVGLMTWWLTGRAMRPVETMRREVEAITASSLGKRVPDPGGRDEIADLARTMNSMLERLDSAQAAQRQFVSDASHELRSPLASVRQNAEVALAYPGALADGELASLTLAETLRMQGLVEALLLLTRSDEMRLQVATALVDLDDLVFTEARRVRSAVSLTVDSSAVGPVQVRGSRQLLDRVVRNLADNAARHAASAVTFTVCARGGAAILLVDDDGRGIAEADRSRVFVRFVRLDEARARDDGGSGLGLAIVQEIVTAHGGTVRVLTSPLGGARFEVVLPAAS